MTTNRDRTARRHPFTPFRKDRPDMFSIEMRMAEAKERHERFRAEAERERMRRSFRAGRQRLRRRLGGWLVRLGHQVGGDAMTAPAWQG